MTRVVVIASSPAMRAGLATLLAGHAGLTVLEGVASQAAFGDSIDTLEADVILLALQLGEDLSLPLSTSSDRTARMPPIVIIGEEPAAAWATRALRSGARAALSHSATADQIFAAVIAAAAGLMVREPASDAPAAHAARSPISARSLQPLTPREVEILGLLAEGLGNKTIAVRLGISEHTVKSHVTSIFTKLEVSSRAEAVASAARLGLIML